MAAADVNVDSEQDILAEDRKRNRTRATALGAIILLLLVVCCWVGLVVTAIVPDVTGMTRAEATESLKDAGFSMEVAEGVTAEAAEGTSTDTKTEAAAPAAKPGTVLEQTPRAGARVLRGTRVVIGLAPAATEGGAGGGNSIISSGGGLTPYTPSPSDDRMYPDNVGTTAADNRPVIPLVGNMPESTATAILRQAGYQPVIGGYNPTTAGTLAGNVYYQDPPFGSRASRGSTVTIWISTGPPSPGYTGSRP